MAVHQEKNITGHSDELPAPQNHDCVFMHREQINTSTCGCCFFEMLRTAADKFSQRLEPLLCI